MTTTSDDSASENAGKPRQHPDQTSAVAAMVVGVIVIAIVGSVVLIGGLYRDHPKPMAVGTLAVIVAAVALVLA